MEGIIGVCRRAVDDDQVIEAPLPFQVSPCLADKVSFCIEDETPGLPVRVVGVKTDELVEKRVHDIGRLAAAGGPGDEDVCIEAPLWNDKPGWVFEHLSGPRMVHLSYYEVNSVALLGPGGESYGPPVVPFLPKIGSVNLLHRIREDEEEEKGDAKVRGRKVPLMTRRYSAFLRSLATTIRNRIFLWSCPRTRS